MTDKYLGEYEQMVLLTVLHLGDGAYGVRIMEELGRRVGRRTSRGSLYVTLDRLERKGLLESRLADPSPTRGGRRKRYVSVTNAGLAALRKSRWALMELWQDLESLLDEAR